MYSVTNQSTFVEINLRWTGFTNPTILVVRLLQHVDGVAHLQTPKKENNVRIMVAAVQDFGTTTL